MISGRLPRIDVAARSWITISLPGRPEPITVTPATLPCIDWAASRAGTTSASLVSPLADVTTTLSTIVGIGLRTR
jgi:hypothetical protein